MQGRGAESTGTKTGKPVQQTDVPTYVQAVESESSSSSSLDEPSHFSFQVQRSWASSTTVCTGIMRSDL